MPKNKKLFSIYEHDNGNQKIWGSFPADEKMDDFWKPVEQHINLSKEKSDYICLMHNTQITGGLGQLFGP